MQSGLNLLSQPVSVPHYALRISPTIQNRKLQPSKEMIPNQSFHGLPQMPASTASSQPVSPAPVRTVQPTPLDIMPLTTKSRNDAERTVELSPDGRYAKLNVILGKGAYKVVYHALDREEGLEVAWNSFQTSKAEFVELSQEIEILKRVRHPNIINFHDCWYSGHEFVFVTELMTSGTLREYIKRLQIPNLRIVKRWCRQVLKGLEYLHGHQPPIIHRDIKCDNIFINGASGEVKIGDMGTAKMKQGKKYTVIGTPEFMAPEMYEEKGYSELVDVYAFGMCLLEMVTGEYPYGECKNAAQIYKKVSRGQKPDCLHKVLDQEVLDIINHCIGPECERLSSRELLTHPFLTGEPDVTVLSVGETDQDITFQVIFQGSDRTSIKFPFKIGEETAEDVVSEMLQETQTPAGYKNFITFEINRILSESSRARSTMSSRERAQRLPQGCLTPKHSHSSPFPADDASDHSINRLADAPLHQNSMPVLPTQSEASTFSHISTDPPQISQDVMTSLPHPTEKLIKRPSALDILDNDPVCPLPLKDYAPESPVNELVLDAASASGRSKDKALEWIHRLHQQDVLMVRDLRALHPEDWANLGLTVFATRTLKNFMSGTRPNVTTSGTGGASPVQTPVDANGIRIAAYQAPESALGNAESPKPAPGMPTSGDTG